MSLEYRLIVSIKSLKCFTIIIILFSINNPIL
jgi:hypothetical protein